MTIGWEQSGSPSHLAVVGLDMSFLCGRSGQQINGE